MEIFVKMFRFVSRTILKVINFFLVPVSRWTKYAQLRVTRHYLPLFDETRAFRLGATKKRIEVISERVKELNKPCSVLDIGANNGYFVRKLAEQGHFGIGVELEDCYVDLGRFMIDYNRLRNVGLIQLLISEENIESLPTCDVVMFLSIFQKVIKQLGIEKAKKVLQGIWSKTGSYFFFEMPDVLESEERFKADLPAEGKTKEECNLTTQNFLQDLLNPSSIELIDQYSMDYSSERRTLFLLKK